MDPALSLRGGRLEREGVLEGFSMEREIGSQEAALVASGRVEEEEGGIEEGDEEDGIEEEDEEGIEEEGFETSVRVEEEVEVEEEESGWVDVRVERSLRLVCFFRRERDACFSGVEEWVGEE